MNTYQPGDLIEFGSDADGWQSGVVMRTHGDDCHVVTTLQPSPMTTRMPFTALRDHVNAAAINPKHMNALRACILRLRQAEHEYVQANVSADKTIADIFTLANNPDAVLPQTEEF